MSQIFTWNGATIESEGINEVEYVADETPMVSYVNVHVVLDGQRARAKASARTVDASQEDAADEIANMIAQFVLSLPKSVRQNSEEPVPEHIQRMFDEANGQHEDHHNHHHEGAPDYINMYGMGQGWGS